MITTPCVAELAPILRQRLPSNSAHDRNDAFEYEDYRRQALAVLISVGLTQIRANAIVDDCIAFNDTRPNLITKAKRSLTTHGNRAS